LRGEILDLMTFLKLTIMEIYVYMDTEPQFAVTEEISKINNVPQE